VIEELGELLGELGQEEGPERCAPALVLPLLYGLNLIVSEDAAELLPALSLYCT
jgi:hypothetical protein